jgi:predicted dehydrogenase
MNKLKVGVIGCGYWGPKLARNFHEMPETELAWVADLSAERLAHMQKLYPEVQATQNHNDILASDTAAVVIATPVSTHYKLALQALNAGKHILVEKPLATTSAHAIEIAETADRLGLMALVGHTFQYNPAVREIHNIIARGDLGQVYYINATRVNLGLFQPDINVMWDLAPHDISIMMDVLGMMPEQVSASGGTYVRPGSGLPEVVYINLHFPNGVMANIRVSWLDPVKTRRITVIGSKKMLVYDDVAEDKLIIYDQGVDIPPYSDTPEQFQLSYRHGSEVTIPLDWREPLRMECERFVQCISEESKTCAECGLLLSASCSHAWFGAKVVKVLEAAQKSLMNGGGRETISL